MTSKTKVRLAVMTKLSKRAHRRCKLFNCDRRRGSFCCADCGYKQSGSCKNPCLNGPMRCGQVVPEGEKKDDT